MYKVAKLVKKVPIFQGTGIFIPAESIVIDKATKAGGGTEDIIIGWFDKSKDSDLFEYCSKVNFGISFVAPAGISGYTADIEDVESHNMYKSNESFDKAAYRTFLKDNADVIAVSEFLPVSGSGYTDLVKPAELSINNDDIRLAIIPLSRVADVSSVYVHAWTIKSDISDTGNTAEIVAIS